LCGNNSMFGLVTVQRLREVNLVGGTGHK
jgi:hypothetical protein